MAAPIDFYFEFASPYGYLASTRIDAIAARHGREAFWHPIMLGAAFKLTGAQPLVRTPLKGDYMMRDLPRFARLLGVPFKAPPVMPANSLAASRAFIWLRQDDPARPRRWREPSCTPIGARGGTSARAEQVRRRDGRASLGIERARRCWLRWPTRQSRNALKQATEAAIERGVFGSPFVLVDGEAFWGADRLDQVERWLAAGGW